MQTGVALVFGPLLAAPALWLANALGLPLSPFAAMSGLALVATLLLVPAWLLGHSQLSFSTQQATTRTDANLMSPRLDRLLFAILLAVITLRLASLLPDLLLRPVFPWDAWKTWVWKARAWFEAGELFSFVSAREWLTTPAQTQTIEGTNHPDTVSLLILWSAIALGRWDDSLLGLPWMLCTIGMALCIYGALRQQRLPPLLALTAVYLLLSLPMIATHTALYGYADLWMTGLFATLVAGLLNWHNGDRLGGLVLISASLVIMAFIKDTGSYWIPVVIGGLLAITLPNRWLIRAAAAAAVGGLVILILGVDPIALITQGRFRLDPRPQAAVWSGMARHLFIYLDWHLLGYLLPLILAAAAWTATKIETARSLLILLLATLSSLLLAFALTRAGEYAIIGTLFSRMFMHLIPIIAVLTALSIWEWRLTIRGKTAQ